MSEALPRDVSGRRGLDNLGRAGPSWKSLDTQLGSEALPHTELQCGDMVPANANRFTLTGAVDRHTASS